MFAAKYSLPGKITSTQPNCNDKVYLGVAEKSLKDKVVKVVKVYNHTKSFSHEDYANDIELSKEYWEIKINNFIPKVAWSIIREFPSHNLSKRKCNLYLNEN